LAVKILEGEFKEGDRVKIDSAGETLLFDRGESSRDDEASAQVTLH